MKSNQIITVCPPSSDPERQLPENVRYLQGHEVGGAAECSVSTDDAIGQGGAHHRYTVSWKAKTDDPNPCVYSPKWLKITFQNGPIKEFGQNGITQESLLAVLIDRLQCFQSGPFSSPDNAEALTHLNGALECLQRRTRARIARGVEGQNKV